MKKVSLLFIKLALVGFVLAGSLLIYLDATIRYTFDGKKWSLPAQVYARPLELYSDRKLDQQDLEYELEQLGYRQVNSANNSGEWSKRGRRVEIFTRGFSFADEKEAARKVAIEFSGKRIEGLYTQGRDLALMRLDPIQIGGIYPRHGEDRVLVRLDDVPPTLSAGLVAVEDRNFYRHFGVSPLGILRAAWANLRSGRVVQGGSTLTQQLVKNYYLTRQKTLVRKAIEAAMAVLLELHSSKSEILEGYINEVYLGQDGPRAIHGFALASQHYFDLPLDQLGLHQQALLVGMVKGPSLYNPRRNPEQTIKRRNLVLDIMYQQNVLTREQVIVAKAMPLDLNQHHAQVNSYPAFLDLVRRQLRRDYREKDLSSMGLKIFTTFDPLVQRSVENNVKKVMDSIDPAGVLEAAMLVSGVDNGEVKALIGGRRPRYAGFNRALDAVRPVGSLLKPAVYLTALEKPDQYSLATIISDEPFSVTGENGVIWQPRNFDRKSHGELMLHRAFSHSYNQAAARLGMDLGIKQVVTTLRRLGIDRPLPEVPSLMLGAGGLSVSDVATMYQTIAAGGFRLPLRSIRNIVDAQGQLLKRYPLEYERAISVQAMHLIHYALQEVMREGTGKTAYRQLPADFNVAGKTGTTNDLRDSWFAGFSGDLVTTAWVGRDDNGNTGLTGTGGALKLWTAVMADVSQSSLAYRVPSQIEHYWIDDPSGLLSGENCKNSRLIPFIKNSQPRIKAACVHRSASAGLRDWFNRLFD